MIKWILIIIILLCGLVYMSFHITILYYTLRYMFIHFFYMFGMISFILIILFVIYKILKK
jgi:hypothetical protein